MLTAASTQSLFKGSGCKGRDSDIFRPKPHQILANTIKYLSSRLT